ncbi:MAG: hypothetical protein ABH803_00275 [Candidatus Micrarchaeota archaeon]
MTQYLIHFFGREHPSTPEATVLVNQLERDQGVSIERLEVWHNHQNFKLFKKILKKGAPNSSEMQVPLFYNKKTGKTITGVKDYQSLVAWANGK